MKKESIKTLNLMGFFSEDLKDGTIKYYYQDRFSGLISELNEYEYFDRIKKVLRGANLVEKICIN